MWSWITGGKDDSDEDNNNNNNNTQASGKPIHSAAPFVLLVIGGSAKNNWYQLFSGCVVRGRPIQVEMCAWDHLEVTSFSDGATTVSLRGNPVTAIPGTSMSSSRTVVPNLVLVRSACQGIEGILTSDGIT